MDTENFQNCEGDGLPMESSSKLTRPNMMQNMKGVRIAMKRSEPPPLIQLNKGGGLPANIVRGLQKRMPTPGPQTRGIRAPSYSGQMVVRDYGFFNATQPRATGQKMVAGRQR